MHTLRAYLGWQTITHTQLKDNESGDKILTLNLSEKGRLQNPYTKGYGFEVGWIPWEFFCIPHL
jgi:hypothetical protein